MMSSLPVAGDQGRMAPIQRPAVSVVVPTHNRAELLPALLDALVAQRVHAIPYEILVIDNGSVDGTAAAVGAYASPWIHYVFEPRPGVSNARNTGMQHAAAKLVAFLDDDLLPAGDWLLRLKDAMDAHPEADCVGGRIDP